MLLPALGLLAVGWQLCLGLFYVVCQTLSERLLEGLGATIALVGGAHWVIGVVGVVVCPASALVHQLSHIFF